MESQRSYKYKLDNLLKTYGIRNVSFLGFMNDTRCIMGQSDIYVCSSNFEASPMAVWEAMSSGLPVISTDVGDIKKIFSEHDCGVCVPTSAPDKLADALQSLLTQPERMQYYSRKGRETAKNLFDINNVKKQYISFYNEVISMNKE